MWLRRLRFACLRRFAGGWDRFGGTRLRADHLNASIKQPLCSSGGISLGRWIAGHMPIDILDCICIWNSLRASFFCWSEAADQAFSLLQLFTRVFLPSAYRLLAGRTVIAYADNLPGSSLNESIRYFELPCFTIINMRTGESVE